jgi:hypothetical protein
LKISIKTPQNRTPVFKRPAFLLVGMMRSGSNFLERQLNLLPDVRCHGELFNTAFVGFSHEASGRPEGYKREDTAARNADEEGFIAKVDQACDRRIIGLRLFLDHSAHMTARLLHDPNVAKIVLSRNLLEAYISLETARETGVWLTTESAKAPPKPVKVENFAADMALVLHKAGVRRVPDVQWRPWRHGPAPFSFEQVLTPELQALLDALYEPDYRHLGYRAGAPGDDELPRLA